MKLTRQEKVNYITLNSKKSASELVNLSDEDLHAAYLKAFKNSPFGKRMSDATGGHATTGPNQT